MTTLQEAAQRAHDLIDDFAQAVIDYEKRSTDTAWKARDSVYKALRAALANEPQAEPAVCGRGCVCLTQCGDAYEHAGVSAPPAEQPGAVGLSDEQIDTLMPIGEAEVLWFDPRSRFGPEPSGKIIDASMAFMSSAPLGTELFSREQVRETVRAAIAAAQPVAASSEEMRAELAGHEAASGHLSALVDDLRGLLAESMRVMKALHESATPDDGPDMDAIIPAGAFRQFVGDNAQLMHLIHVSPHELPVAAGWLPIETAPKDMGSYLFLCNGVTVQGFRDATGEMCVCIEAGASWSPPWRRMRRKPSHWMPLPPAATQGAKT